MLAVAMQLASFVLLLLLEVWQLPTTGVLTTLNAAMQGAKIRAEQSRVPRPIINGPTDVFFSEMQPHWVGLYVSPDPTYPRQQGCRDNRFADPSTLCLSLALHVCAEVRVPTCRVLLLSRGASLYDGDNSACTLLEGSLACRDVADVVTVFRLSCGISVAVGVILRVFPPLPPPFSLVCSCTWM